MSRITPARYVGMFHDRDRTPLDVDTDGEIFFSLHDAKNRFRTRVTSGGYRDVVYPVCRDGLVATCLYFDDSELFPNVTEDAFIDLYALVPDTTHKGWGFVGEPVYRLWLGPHFGVHVDRF